MTKLFDNSINIFKSSPKNKTKLGGKKIITTIQQQKKWLKIN